MGPFALHVVVRDTTAGLPNTTILADVLLSSGASALTNVIALPVAVPQVAGHRYAIVVDYPSAPPAGANEFQGTWQGATGNVYPQGGNVASNNNQTWDLPSRPKDPICISNECLVQLKP